VYSPEFQSTTETTMVGGLNFFAKIIRDGGYGYKENQLKLEFTLFDDVAGDANALIDRINLLFMNQSMTQATRTSMMRAVNGIDVKSKTERIRAALTLAAIAPEFVIQK
jgi:endo-chitodextinase